MGSLGASILADDYLGGAGELTDAVDDAGAEAHEVRAEDGEHAPRAEGVA